MSPMKVVPVNAGKVSVTSSPHTTAGLTFQAAQLNGTGPASSPIANSRGWVRFTDSVNLTGPIFYPFTDLTAYEVNRNNVDGYIFDWELPWGSDGAYGWVRVAEEVRKYSMTGGAALETLPMPYFGPAPIRTNGAEVWCFAPDKHNIYMAGNTTYNDGHTLFARISYGPIGSDPLPIWVDLTGPANDENDIRNFTFINEICVDDSTGHVFIMWDPEQQYQLPLFIDEYAPDATFVTRWIPRTSLAPAPGAVGDPTGYPPSGLALGSQGTSFYGPMCAADGFLYVNMDLYWSADPIGRPGGDDGGRLEDAIWKINTATREGEDEIWVRLNRTPEEQAATATLTPMLAIDTDGRRVIPVYFHFWSTSGPLAQDVDVFDVATGTRLLTALNPAGGLGLSNSGTAHDSSGHGRDGFYTLTGFNTYQFTGLIPGDSAFVTASEPGVSVPAITILGSSDFAIEFWVRGYQWGVDLSGGHESGSPGLVGVVSAIANRYSPSDSIFVQGETVTNFSTPGGSVPNDGQARHIVFRKNGGTLEVYINGAFSASGAIGATSGLTDTVLTLGAGSLVICTFDELATYSSLSPTRIAAHYAARGSFSGYNAAVMADSPTGYYHLDDPGPRAFTIGQPRFVGGHGPLVPAVAKPTRVVELQQNTVNAGKQSTP